MVQGSTNQETANDAAESKVACYYQGPDRKLSGVSIVTNDGHSKNVLI
jgi:hypothetical protein